MADKKTVATVFAPVDDVSEHTRFGRLCVGGGGEGGRGVVPRVSWKK
jgi:hypothetical protein